MRHFFRVFHLKLWMSEQLLKFIRNNLILFCSQRHNFLFNLIYVIVIVRPQHWLSESSKRWLIMSCIQWLHHYQCWSALNEIFHQWTLKISENSWTSLKRDVFWLKMSFLWLFLFYHNFLRYRNSEITHFDFQLTLENEANQKSPVLRVADLPMRAPCKWIDLGSFSNFEDSSSCQLVLISSRMSSKNQIWFSFWKKCRH